MFSKQTEGEDDKTKFEITKNISFKSVPKYFRNKETVAFLIEKIENKT